MFLLNLGFQWKMSTSVQGLKGAILLPSQNSSPRVMREAPRDLKYLLLDPQVYLAQLEVDGRTKACARLAGYPWFGISGVEDFDSSVNRRTEWEKQLREQIAHVWPGRPPSDIEAACYRALEIQVEIGCSHAIIPAPLITAREDEGGTLGDWIDAGIEASEDLDIPIPLLATVAISEQALNELAFQEDGFLDAIVDQVSARDRLDGVYIVIGQTRKVTHPFQSSVEVARAYLQLSNRFSLCGLQEIVTNFADLTGLLCMAVGATSFAGGASSNHRLLSLDGFPDKSGGKAFPYYYSNKCAGEFLTETHLDQLVENRAFRRIRDVTSFSGALVEELLNGGSASNLPAWAEGQNNYRTAHKHFVQRMIHEGRLWGRLDSRARLEHAKDWLDECEANMGFIAERVTERIGRYASVASWNELLDEYR